jgi:hypothetical protein
MHAHQIAWPDVQLLQVEGISATADPDLNAVSIEIADPVGAGVAFLLGPEHVNELMLDLVAALGQLRPDEVRAVRF